MKIDFYRYATMHENVWVADLEGRSVSVPAEDFDQQKVVATLIQDRKQLDADRVRIGAVHPARVGYAEHYSMTV
jgi:hypothetical protein